MIFGNTDDGSPLSHTMSANRIHLIKPYSPAVDGLVTSISCLVSSKDGANMKAALYDASDDSLLGVTNEITVSGNGTQYVTLPFASPIAVEAAKSYGLAANNDYNSGILKVSNYSDPGGYYENRAYPNFTDPFSGTGLYLHIIYATYELAPHYIDVSSRFYELEPNYIDTPSRFYELEPYYIDMDSRLKLSIPWIETPTRYHLLEPSYIDIATRFYIKGGSSSSLSSKLLAGNII